MSVYYRRNGDGQIYINDVLLTDKMQRQQTLMTLSAGQKMLFVRLLSILSSIEHGSLVIVEEPELHLDPLWCAGLVQIFGAFFGQFHAHIIISTQNLSVIRCFPAKTIILMTEKGPRQFDENLFLASESVVADELYRGTSLTSLDELVLKRILRMKKDQQEKELRSWGKDRFVFLLVTQ